MKPINRREALVALAATGSALALGNALADESANYRLATRMGIVTYALGIHQRQHWAGKYKDLFAPVALLEEAHRLGLGGIQVDLGPQDASCADDLRARAERYGMYVEASIMPPKNADDVPRFEAAIRTAQNAGATLARTVILPGRRYEEFKSLADFRAAEQRGLEALQRAEPILARLRFRLAMENHKGQRIPEKLATLKQLSSEFVGVCVDFGNSFTLLEDPLAVVRAYAPWAMTVHLKDQAVRENEDGFWFGDVALGEGCLPLAAMVEVLRQARPEIHFNFETITRDPLRVPILRPEFWTTMPDVPARDLARTLRVIKEHPARQPLVEVSKLSPAGQRALELRHIRQSAEYARQKLAMG